MITWSEPGGELQGMAKSQDFNQDSIITSLCVGLSRWRGMTTMFHAAHLVIEFHDN